MFTILETTLTANSFICSFSITALSQDASASHIYGQFRATNPFPGMFLGGVRNPRVPKTLMDVVRVCKALHGQ